MIEMRVSAGDLQSVPKACVEWKTEELCLHQRLPQHCLSESFLLYFYCLVSNREGLGTSL